MANNLFIAFYVYVCVCIYIYIYIYIYGLPKIHKDGVPLWLILSMVGSAQQKVASWLSSVLQPVLEHFKD